jgi:hypothetical protein
MHGVSCGTGQLLEQRLLRGPSSLAAAPAAVVEVVYYSLYSVAICIEYRQQEWGWAFEIGGNPRLVPHWVMHAAEI